MTRRILFVDQSGQLGGGELSLVDVAVHFSPESEVVLFEDGPFRTHLEAAGVRVQVLEAPRGLRNVRREGGGGLGLGAVPGVLALARRLARAARGYDLIAPNTQKALVVSALAGVLARKPVLWFLRDILSPEHFSRPIRQLVVTLCNKVVTRVIANSRASAEAFVLAGGNLRRVRVLHDGLDTAALLRQAGEGVPDLRASLGLTTEPLVGVFSRLSPWKGQHVLLRALTELPGVHALLVGDALFGEEAYAQELRRLTREWGLEDRVHFLGFRGDVPALMRSVDVVLHTSTAAEPLGRVILEGMLARRPVIATAAGGALEIVRDGESGLLVPPGEAPALAAAIRRVLDDRALAERLVARGLRRAQEGFGLASMLVRLQGEIDSIVAVEAER
ncbi:hypothetical protein DEIPH_ctg076orf0022 [Deinococcus phoenicis]|uniref:Group 1 glycosyl transferase n=1 Tax=Deinococcus phoenicis TaxID=1476583 RepID=A0A016QLK0_9DEIO|nr:glycosyltransferase family 4 protein [Deinococcus phoenicis]EYB66762.1 hypothetical protein DEIPH_ctg076orf0022 [Deinococcus phoenicis]